MNTGTAQQIDWKTWLDRWDRQQEGYLPDREARFAMMLDICSDLLPASFLAIDLACGPGAISARLLHRFPGARAIAVDYDPVLLLMGESALGDQDGRLQWVSADLESADWHTSLRIDQVDAVLSTTALHWLDEGSLRRLYRDLAALIRPGGIFLNGDNMAFPAELPTFQRLASLDDERQQAEAFRARGQEDWKQWWEAIGREPGMAELLKERDRRFISHNSRNGVIPPPGFDVHVDALRQAGFSEVGTIWQNRDNRILLAVR
ncbi:MAG: class I SAM-dependent methyltransferase [Thermomicrobiales bacterium]|nr:class I SAM-dependent methyltransferase [Thermomicrobiales bacterium]